MGPIYDAPNKPSKLKVSLWESEEHTSELQSHHDLVCRLLLEKKTANIAPKSARTLSYTNFDSSSPISASSRYNYFRTANATAVNLSPQRTNRTMLYSFMDTSR